jgi:hypothetical protein
VCLFVFFGFLSWLFYFENVKNTVSLNTIVDDAVMATSQSIFPPHIPFILFSPLFIIISHWVVEKILIYLFTAAPAVTFGSENTLRVVKSGSSYTFFYNTGAGFEQLDSFSFDAPIILAGPCILLLSLPYFTLSAALISLFLIIFYF